MIMAMALATAAMRRSMRIERRRWRCFPCLRAGVGAYVDAGGGVRSALLFASLGVDSHVRAWSLELDGTLCGMQLGEWKKTWGANC